MNWKPPQTVTINPPEMPSWVNGRTALLVVVGLGLLAAAFTSIYTVPFDSSAVVMRFGEFKGTKPPGLQYKLPFGIDKAVILPVERQLKLEFGFGTAGAGNTLQATPMREQELEKAIITGDRNAVLVEWVVQYRIADPELFLFRVRNPEETLRAASESVMRQIVGDRSVDEVLTIGRQEIESEVQRGLASISERYQFGLSITQVQLKDVTPPLAVQASFNEVNQSQQEKERLINEARGEYNRAVPRASGEAQRAIAEANGRATRRINEAEGDAERFVAVFDQYMKAPEVTRQRLYLETMAEVLPTFRRRILMDNDAAGVLPLLQLDTPSAPPANR